MGLRFDRALFSFIDNGKWVYHNCVFCYMNRPNVREINQI